MCKTTNITAHITNMQFAEDVAEGLTTIPNIGGNFGCWTFLPVKRRSPVHTRNSSIGLFEIIENLMGFKNYFTDSIWGKIN